jgi:2-keto-3-deoxy-L-rhamnonate aldolase RhmA
VFFVAPSDLAQTMGYIGNHTHPTVQKVIDEAITQIVTAGRTAGTLVNDENVERYLELGVRFVMNSWTGWVAKGATAYLKQVAAKPSAAPR